MNLPRFSTLPLCFLLILSAPVAVAQARDSVPDNSPVNPQALIQAFDFPGGSLGAFAQQFQEQTKARFNLVVAPTALGTPLPKFELRGASAEGVTMALNALLPPGLRADFAPRISEFGRAVVTISGTPVAAVPTSAGTFTRTFPIAHLEQRFKATEIADAASQAWALDPGHHTDDLKLKLHPATHLLIASGPQEAIEIVADALMSMERSAQTAPESHP